MIYSLFKIKIAKKILQYYFNMKTGACQGMKERHKRGDFRSVDKILNI
jgi:hypothetical protein